VCSTYIVALTSMMNMLRMEMATLYSVILKGVSSLPLHPHNALVSLTMSSR
jgi:hypothetical protein